jgi:hypothetical protein
VKYGLRKLSHLSCTAVQALYSKAIISIWIILSVCVHLWLHIHACIHNIGFNVSKWMAVLVHIQETCIWIFAQGIAIRTSGLSDVFFKLYTQTLG